MENYQLIRSNRKTLALSIDTNGTLIVRAPFLMQTPQINAFIQKQRSWIEQTRRKVALLPPVPRFSPEDGAAIPYFGRSLTLQSAAVTKVTLYGDVLQYPAQKDAAVLIIRWLEKQARQELQRRIQALSQPMNQKPATFRLSRAKGRWGSMSTRGTLSLNRALVHCPSAVIDYVIIHELCHIPHPNHSPAFWHEVEYWMPDYRSKKQWLKVHSSLVSFLPDGK